MIRGSGLGFAWRLDTTGLGFRVGSFKVSSSSPSDLPAVVLSLFLVRVLMPPFSLRSALWVPFGARPNEFLVVCPLL